MQSGCIQLTERGCGRQPLFAAQSLIKVVRATVRPLFLRTAKKPHLPPPGDDFYIFFVNYVNFINYLLR